MKTNDSNEQLGQLMKKRYFDLYFKKESMSQYVYKYRDFSEQNISNLNNNCLWFSKIEKFNDPFEGRLRSVDPFDPGYCETLKGVGITSLQDEEVKEFKKMYLEIFSPLSKDVKICCFSSIPDDILMWSHYAGQHTGYCLRFDMLEDVDFFSYPLSVKYDSQYAPSDIIHHPEKILEHIFQRKFEEWSYEKEVRVIKKSERNSFKYKKNALIEVIFGCRSKESDISTVKNILGSSVKYKKCEPSQTEFRLNLLDLN